MQVRSLNLDEWPAGHLAVMTGLGNQLANSIWEHKITLPYRKPKPDSPRYNSIKRRGEFSDQADLVVRH